MPEAVVARTGDLEDGKMTQVSVGETDLLLARVDGEYRAIYAYCSHYGAPLAQGALSEGRVVCPWHHACFDTDTGAHLEPPGLDDLERFDVRVEGEQIVVSVPEEVEGILPPIAGGRRPSIDDRTIAVIGGGAAGAYAAEEIRLHSYAGRLVMVTAEEDLPYDRPNCSKDYLAGEAREEWMPLRERSFYDEHDVECWTDTVVTGLDAGTRTITFADGETLEADGVLVATGGRPRRLEVPGEELDGVFNLRSWADSRAIRVRAERADRAVVVGASFIGMEAAQSLRHHDLEITVVAPEKVPFERVLGERVGRLLKDLHERNEIRFRLGRTVRSVEGDGDVERLVLDDGEVLPADLVVVGVGVRPATEFTDGLEKTSDGGIRVDEHMRAAEGVYAAGDVAAFPDPRTGEAVRFEHWRVAAQHGRIAGANLIGADVAYRGVPFFWTGQLGRNLRYVGHAPGWDEVVFPGEPTDRDLLACYVRDGTIRALAGIGRDREMAAAEELMRRGALPDPGEVRGGSVDWIERLRALRP